MRTRAVNSRVHRVYLIASTHAFGHSRIARPRGRNASERLCRNSLFPSRYFQAAIIATDPSARRKTAMNILDEKWAPRPAVGLCPGHAVVRRVSRVATTFPPIPPNFLQFPRSSSREVLVRRSGAQTHPHPAQGMFRPILPLNCKQYVINYLQPDFGRFSVDKPPLAGAHSPRNFLVSSSFEWHSEVAP